MSFQDALYTLEVGKGKRLIQATAIVMGFAFLSLLYLVLVFHGFSQPGAMDMAQLSRQIGTGKGYTTKLIRPSALHEFSSYYASPSMVNKTPQPKIDVFAMPDISNAPVYPVVTSLIYRVVPKSDWFKLDPTPQELAKAKVYAPERLIVLFNELCVFLTAAVLYVWALRMFDDRVAFLATIAFVGCDLIWQFAISGLSTCWVLLVFTAWGASVHELLLAEEQDRRPAIWGWAVGSAVLLALVILSRLMLAWLIIPYGVLLMVALRRLVFPALMAIVLAVALICPWFVRNYQVCGSFFGTGLDLVQGQGTVAEAYGDRTYDQENRLPVKHGLSKLYTGFGYGLSNFYILEGSCLLTVLFVAALMHRFKRQRTQFMRWFIMGCGFVILVGGSLLWPEPKPTEEGNSLILILPGLITVGAAFFYILLDRLDIGLQIVRYMAVTFFVIICCFPVAMTLIHPPTSSFCYPPYYSPMIRFDSLMLEPNEMMVSDIPEATAWYGDRVSLWMPTTLKEFYEINDSIQLASGMLLTPASWDYSLYKIDKGFAKDWAPILRRQGVPSGFPLSLYTAMPPLDNEYLFFSDKKRW